MRRIVAKVNASSSARDKIDVDDDDDDDDDRQRDDDGDVIDDDADADLNVDADDERGACVPGVQLQTTPLALTLWLRVKHAPDQRRLGLAMRLRGAAVEFFVLALVTVCRWCFFSVYFS